MLSRYPTTTVDTSTYSKITTLEDNLFPARTAHLKASQDTIPDLQIKVLNVYSTTNRDLALVSFVKKEKLLSILTSLMISWHGIILILIILAKTARIALSIQPSILLTWKLLFANMLIIARSVRKLKFPPNGMVIYLKLISFVIPGKSFKLTFFVLGHSKISLSTLITSRVHPLLMLQHVGLNYDLIHPKNLRTLPSLSISDGFVAIRNLAL
jgi:hypothetical protein